MTRQETGVIMDVLTAAYPRFYSGPDAPDKRQTVNLWAEMFADDDVALVAAAVKSYIAADRKGFPPHIGAIKNAMLELTRSGELAKDMEANGPRLAHVLYTLLEVTRSGEPDAAQAWALVRRAASRSAYGAREEFERLPEDIRRIVGAPSQLFEWSQWTCSTASSPAISSAPGPPGRKAAAVRPSCPAGSAG